MPSDGFDSVKCCFRFGFDPKTDDYKVVKLTALVPPRSVVRWWLQIEIYSMRKGTWELITERFPSHITAIRDVDYVCADGHDGHLHWLCGIGEIWKLKTIVAFDLGSQTFREIPLPHSTLDHFRNMLGVLAGELCVMSYDGHKTFDVWVMEEYGVAESWVKRHAISWLGDVGGIFGFTSHNEFLVDDDGCIVLHDPIAKKETYLENFHPGRGGPAKIAEYVESLVWVTPDKQEMVDGA